MCRGIIAAEFVIPSQLQHKFTFVIPLNYLPFSTSAVIVGQYPSPGLRKLSLPPASTAWRPKSQCNIHCLQLWSLLHLGWRTVWVGGMFSFLMSFQWKRLCWFYWQFQFDRGVWWWYNNWWQAVWWVYSLWCDALSRTKRDILLRYLIRTFRQKLCLCLKCWWLLDIWWYSIGTKRDIAYKDWGVAQ